MPKQKFGEAKSPFKMKGSPFKQEQIKPIAGETYTKYIDRAFDLSKSPEGRDVMGKRNFQKAMAKAGGKTISRFLGPVVLALTGYEAIKTIPKVVKSTLTGLKERAKSGNVNIGRKL